MVDWLLKGTPRQVQVEALRRSYYGEALYDRNPEMYDLDEPAPRVLRDGPRKGWGHFLQMRLGKTPVALNEFELFRRDHGFRNAIIFTPAKYRADWVLEAERFGLSVPAIEFESSREHDTTIFAQKHSRNFLLSVNYEALIYKKNLAVLEALCDDKTYIGADESIQLKTAGGKFVQGAIPLAKLCGARRAFSGKPITQGPHDMWGQLRFIDGIQGINPVVWKATYCEHGGFQGKKVVGAKNEQQFWDIRNACSWAARRADWLVTPGVDYAECVLRLDGEQQRLYNQMQEEFLVELADGKLVVADQIVIKLIKLQQIACGFIIDEDKNVHSLVSDEKNVRLQEIVRMLDEDIEGKAIVIANHTHSILMLRRALAKYKPAEISGRGGLNTVDEKRRFNGEDDCRVCIGQTKAIKYGHTLMGQPNDPCSTILMFENTYSLDDRSQLEERPQGEGQQFPITVWDFLATKGDRAPIRALQRKEDVAALMLQYDRRTGILPPKPELRAT